MKKVRALSVGYNGRPVGRLAQTPDGFSAFEYNSDWLAAGFSISPFSLPLKDGVLYKRGASHSRAALVFSPTVCRMAGDVCS